MVSYLEQLVGTGLYGLTAEEAAERILCRVMEEWITHGDRWPFVKVWGR